MNFEAELKRSSQRKSASLDNVYQVVFETDNPMVLDLGKLPPDTLFRVTIDIDEPAKSNTFDTNTDGLPSVEFVAKGCQRAKDEN